jgi:LPS O-antigen subunit length determinant protein (WzzB/FepE family)
MRMFAFVVAFVVTVAVVWSIETPDFPEGFAALVLGPLIGLVVGAFVVLLVGRFWPRR